MAKAVLGALRRDSPKPQGSPRVPLLPELTGHVEAIGERLPLGSPGPVPGGAFKAQSGPFPGTGQQPPPRGHLGSSWGTESCPLFCPRNCPGEASLCVVFKGSPGETLSGGDWGTGGREESQPPPPEPVPFPPVPGGNPGARLLFSSPPAAVGHGEILRGALFLEGCRRPLENRLSQHGSLKPNLGA